MENNQNIVPEPNKTSPVWIILLIVVILVLIGLNYWYWYKNYYENSWQGRPQPTSYLTTKPTTTTTVSPASTSDVQEQLTKLDSENSELYSNTKYGYSIRYPKSWSISAKEANAESIDFASATDMFDGAVVSISVSEEKTTYETIQEWIENRPVGDPEGAEAKENTEYVENKEYGTTYAKTQTPQFDLLTYHWKCGDNIMILSYVTSRHDYEIYMPTFEAMFESLVPCAG